MTRRLAESKDREATEGEQQADQDDQRGGDEGERIEDARATYQLSAGTQAVQPVTQWYEEYAGERKRQREPEAVREHEDDAKGRAAQGDRSEQDHERRW